MDKNVPFSLGVPKNYTFNYPVDIIIPFHGEYTLLTKLIENILRFTRSSPKKIILVDDASTNSHFFNKDFKPLYRNTKDKNTEIKIIRFEEPIGFGAALNAGYENSNSPFVVFLNSDCQINNLNWLSGMGDTLISLKNQDVRLVSAKTNNIVGGCNQMLSPNFQETEDYILEENEHCSLVCCLFERSLLKEIGPIQPYPYGWFEDQELAFRMYKNGFKQAVCGKSWVYHIGECTIKSILKRNVNILKIMEDNYKLFKTDVNY